MVKFLSLGFIIKMKITKKVRQVTGTSKGVTFTQEDLEKLGENTEWVDVEASKNE